MPPHVLNFPVLYKAILDRCCGEYEVVDRSDPSAPVTVTKNVEINRIIEDTRGIPHPLCSKQSPAHVGMCPWCSVEAIPCYPSQGSNGKTRVGYANAVTHLNTQK